MPVVRASLLLLAVLFVGAGCDDTPSEAETMQAAIAPYLDDVARYDRWARRLSLADAAFRSEEALEEAAFAPLRDRRRVRAAWLHREGPDARALAYPDGAPALPSEGWVTVQTPSLGEVQAIQREMVFSDEPQPTMLIRRSRDAGGGATLHVTMAFVMSEAGDTEPADEAEDR